MNTIYIYKILRAVTVTITIIITIGAVEYFLINHYENLEACRNNQDSCSTTIAKNKEELKNKIAARAYAWEVYNSIPTQQKKNYLNPTQEDELNREVHMATTPNSGVTLKDIDINYIRNNFNPTNDQKEDTHYLWDNKQ